MPGNYAQVVLGGCKVTTVESSLLDFYKLTWSSDKACDCDMLGELWEGDILGMYEERGASMLL